MGRPEFEMVVANAAREKMVMSDVSSNTNVNPGQLSNIFVYAPTGFVGEITGLFFEALAIGAPTPATSGTHYCAFGYNDFYLAFGESQYNEHLRWNYSSWSTANQTQWPPAGQTQVNAVKGLMFDDVVPCKLHYTNNTPNGVQTNKRTALIMYKLKQIAK